MKRGVIAVAAVLSLVFVVPAFAVDGSQPPTATATNFEQMKADYLKKLDDRMTSLQQEKTCVQAAKVLDDFKACKPKFNKTDMKERRDEMRMKGHGGPAGEGSPQGK